MLTDEARVTIEPKLQVAWLKRVLSIEWLGQTAASICWICSVLAYGINSSGDWLQLCAALAWLVANIASVIANKAD
jgi:hypothetical protein